MATSLTLETTVCSILSVNPEPALLLLIPGSDCVALESVLAAALLDGRFKLVSVFAALTDEVLTVPDFAAGVTFFAAAARTAVLGAVFDAGSTIAPFTAAALRVAAVFDVGFSLLPMVLASLLALLAAALLAADLVTVAFMVPSFSRNRPLRALPESLSLQSPAATGKAGLYRAPREMSAHIAKRLPSLLDPYQKPQ